MKRKLVRTLLLAIVITLINVVTYALDELPYWYSNVSSIRKHTDSAISVTLYSRESITGMPTSDYETYFNHALNAWTNSLGSSHITFTGVSSGADLESYDITRSEANNMGFPSNAAGFGSMTGTGTNYYSAYYCGSLKSFYSYNSAVLYIIWDDTSSNYSTDAWEYITTHETGHAIGYYGHNTSSSVLMYYSFDPNSIPFTTPRTQDRDHMYLVY